MRDLIIRELEKNLLVEAAAGTGKTTSLVARMINLIREGRCPVDKLAAVTSRARPRRSCGAGFRLGLRRPRGRRGGIEQRRLAEAVAHVERCLSRNHPLLLRAPLRERPVEAGVDPEFVELDDDKDGEIADGVPGRSMSPA